METRVRRVGDENARYVKKQGGSVAAKDTRRTALQTVTNTAAGHPSGLASGLTGFSSQAASKGVSLAPLSRGEPARGTFNAILGLPATSCSLAPHHAARKAGLGEPFGAVPPASTNIGTTAGGNLSDETIEEVNENNETGESEEDRRSTLSIVGSMDLDDERLDHDHSHFFEDDEELPPPINVRSTSNPDALYPVVTAKDRQKLAECAEEVRRTPGILDDDDEDSWDIAMASEYSEGIFKYMRRLEVQMRPDPGYMDRQRELQWSMRTILVDWLVQVHHRFNLLPETLFLTINYIDRFLSIKSVSLSKFQLVGAVALFLAAKYEEINCPSIQEIAYMVDHGYTVDEILKAERFMIDVLDFNLGFPGPMSFLRRTSKADDYDLETRTLAKYLLEITIMDSRFVATPPSWTAAIAHYVAREMLQKGPWTNCHVYFSGYTEEQLLPGVKVLKECCKNPLEHHKAIFEKYCDRRFKKAALYVHEWIRHTS